ncbi:hypothetical protein [Spongiactinospora gelatinilytica]|uniref:hypothetical protein n=1 Tax=Spongiactinospora gelatinilytica TaxID=2666298 RepID=UPI0018F52660|nr:hypothetical protein [Spongiactinospora gelatinilytica]
MWHLRRALDAATPGGRGLLVHRPSGYLLRPAPGSVDAARFAGMVAEARAHPRPERRAAPLTAALALAERDGDPVGLAQARWFLGFARFPARHGGGGPHGGRRPAAARRTRRRGPHHRPLARRARRRPVRGRVRRRTPGRYVLACVDFRWNRGR